MDKIMDAFLLTSIIGGNLSAMTQDTLAASLSSASVVYPAWVQTEEFAKEVRRGVVYAPFTLFSESGYDFATTQRVVEAFGKQYSKFQDQECQAMKTNLLQSE